MLVDVQNIIITALEGLKDVGNKRIFTTVDVWNDTPEEMIKKTIRLPAALVALGGARFTGKGSINSGLFNCRLGWDVFVLFENYRTSAAATAQGLAYIDAVVSGISNTRVGNTCLQPVAFDLVATIGGKSAYVINFELEERMGK